MSCRTIVVLVMLIAIVAGCSKDQSQKVAVAPEGSATAGVHGGEALFKQYCAVCHPNGGNVSDPERALYGSVLRKKHITTPEDIVRIMRNPLSRMIRFDQSTLSDRDARVIAEYVLKTFK